MGGKEALGQTLGPERVELKPIVSEVREIDLSTPDEARHYLRLLINESNRAHFTGLLRRTEDGKPHIITLREFLEGLRNPRLHALVAINPDGLELGFATIRDAEQGQSDNWIERFVIDNRVQSRSRGRGMHVGSQFLKKAVDWAFSNRTFDHRERTKLDTAVIMDIPNSERARRLFRSNGFRVSGFLEDQAEIVVDNSARFNDVMRFSMLKQTWIIKQKQENPS